MRFALGPGARRALRGISDSTVYSAAELVLLSLLALQCARLFWIFFTPVGPIGEWKSIGAKPVQVSPLMLGGSFNPFSSRVVEGGPVVVTSLDLKLFGVREDLATGRGSAIIGLPGGQQRSFVVNEEIMPGVVLTGVAFDSVTISRNGATEQLFLDQSKSAPSPSPSVITSQGAGGGNAPAVISGPTAAPPPPPPAAPLSYQPRLNGGQVTGVTVQPSGDGAAFRAAGLRLGDVIVSVDGQRISSAQQAQALGTQMRNKDVTIQVERGGRTLPLRIRTPQ